MSVLDLLGGGYAKIIGGAALVTIVISGVGWWSHSEYQKGWAARDSLVAKEIATESAKAVDTFKANVADANKINLDTIDKLTTENKRQMSIASQLSARLAAQAKTPFCKENKGEKPLLGQSVLDDESVRLLNDARAGATSNRPRDPAGAASGVAQASRPAAAASHPGAR